jgi:hypothetical protein
MWVNRSIVGDDGLDDKAYRTVLRSLVVKSLIKLFIIE